MIYSLNVEPLRISNMMHPLCYFPREWCCINVIRKTVKYPYCIILNVGGAIPFKSEYLIGACCIMKINYVCSSGHCGVLAVVMHEGEI